MDEKKRDRLRMGDIMRRLGQPDAGRPDAPVKKPDRPPGEPRPAPQEDAGDALPEQPSFGTPPARPVKPAAAAAPQTPDIAIRKLQTPAVVPPQTPAEPRPAPPPPLPPDLSSSMTAPSPAPGGHPMPALCSS